MVERVDRVHSDRQQFSIVTLRILCSGSRLGRDPVGPGWYGSPRRSSSPEAERGRSSTAGKTRQNRRWDAIGTVSTIE